VRRLRIGIDAHAIGERMTGNERFAANVIPAIRELCDHDLVLYFTRPESAGAWSGHPRTRIRLIRPAHPLARIPAVLPWMARRDRLDVLFVQYSGPPVRSCPLVTVVHDVAFARFPTYYSLLERIWMRRTIPWTMRHAESIVTVSEFSRQEILSLYPMDPARITVAHEGVDAIFRDPAPRPSPLEPPFFLAIGNLQPRKNLITLIRAYRKLLRDHPEAPERLVVVGQQWFAAEDLYRESEDLRTSGRAVFTGYVPDEQLVGLLQRATAFCYPSVYEGFGFPPLEAMAAGTPALVADIPVMREVAGAGALRLPATDEGAWAEALFRVSAEAPLRGDLVARGRERADLFTWERCAQIILGALEGAAAAGRRGRGTPGRR
jgi:glycosyltransferase involved in cell wall biosynthesis